MELKLNEKNKTSKDHKEYFLFDDENIQLGYVEETGDSIILNLYSTMNFIKILRDDLQTVSETLDVLRRRNYG